jgi:2'-5' RNA ligase
MKRTFIAIEIKAGATLRDLLSHLKAGLKTDHIKWIDLQQMHITLAFLGDTEESAIKRVSSMLANITAEHKGFTFSISGLGLFRNPHDPRVIWAGIDSSGPMEVLFKAIREGLASIGIKTEERAFKPHLTLGRVKRINNHDVLVSLLEQYRDTTFQKIPVEELIFFESILKQEGPVYIPLSVAKLGK